MSGGGHFGGGLFISAWDMARFGYLFLRGGKWAGREIVSERWIALARTPGPANPNYGFANWYLNTGGKPLTNAPASAVRFVGNGANIIYIWPQATNGAVSLTAAQLSMLLDHPC